MPSGRFFGFVIGGSHPAALAADWLVGAWDQNAVLRQVTPGVAAAEELAAAWLLDLLGLPAGSGVGFATGATTANFTGIAAARDTLLRRSGWDVSRGLAGGPAVRVLAGRERHDSVDLALRYAGLPAPDLVDVDDQGRVLPDSLAERLAGSDAPTLVLLQAGNVHSGACDPFDACVPLAHEHGAWVHVDGAFGLWAAASPSYRHLTAGVERRRLVGDRRAQDAERALRLRRGRRARRGGADGRDEVQGDYLIQGDSDPFDRVPELSRRARGVPVWAALRALGRSGVAEMVDRMCRHAQAFADGDRHDPRCRGGERRGVHAGVRDLRRRRPDPRRRGPDARRRDGVDQRVAVAGPGGAADLGQQRAAPPTTTYAGPSRPCAGPPTCQGVTSPGRRDALTTRRGVSRRRRRGRRTARPWRTSRARRG